MATHANTAEETSSPHNPNPGRTAVLAMPVSAAAAMLAVGSVYVSQPLFGVFAESFDVPIEATGGTFGWPMMAYSLTFLLVAPLTAVLPLRRMMLVGLVVCAAALSLAAQATCLPHLIGALVLGGLGAAIVPAAAFALPPRIARADRVGALFGVLIAASVVGLILGRSASGVAADAIGWRGVYLGVAVLMVLAAVSLAVLPPTGGASRNGVGAAYRAVLGVLGRPEIVVRLVIGGFLFFGYLGLATLLTLRLESAVFGLSTSQIGWLGFSGLVAVAGAPLAGVLVPRLGASTVVIGGLAAAILAAAVLATTASVAAVGGALMLLFGGVFACQPAVLVMLSTRCEADLRGAISSVYLVVCLGAGGLSSLVLGAAWVRFGWDGVALGALSALGLALLIASSLALSEARTRSLSLQSTSVSGRKP